MQSFQNQDGIEIIYGLIDAIQKNKEYLSEIDGLIGDGDHGVNMNKGFTKVKEKLEGKDETMTTGLDILGKTLLTDIGGSMGPLYGALFIGMSKASAAFDVIDSNVFLEMLKNGVDRVKSIGGANVGDKTLVDTLEPALKTYRRKLNEGADFVHILDSMKEAAEVGRNSTRDMVAKLGRASRLGERSRGVVDAGATSCCLILCTMADVIKKIIK